MIAYLILIAQITGTLVGGFMLIVGLMMSSLAGGGEISDITSGMSELGCANMIGGAILASLCLWGLLA